MPATIEGSRQADIDDIFPLVDIVFDRGLYRTGNPGGIDEAVDTAKNLLGRRRRVFTDRGSATLTPKATVPDPIAEALSFAMFSFWSQMATLPPDWMTRSAIA